MKYAASKVLNLPMNNATATDYCTRCSIYYPGLIDRASKTIISGRRIVHGYVNRSLYITICALQLIILLS